MDKNRKTVQPSFCAPTCPQPSWNDRRKKTNKNKSARIHVISDQDEKSNTGETHAVPVSST